MTRFVSTFLLSVAISASDPSSNIEIPLLPLSSNRGVPEVHISIADHVSSIPIVFGRTNTYWRSAQHDEAMEMGVVNITMVPAAGSSEAAISFVDNRYELTFLGHHGGEFARLAIGPGSLLLNRFDSIAVIQNATNPIMLSIRSLQDNFENFCRHEIITAKIESHWIHPRFRGELFIANRLEDGLHHTLNNKISLINGCAYIGSPAIILGFSLFTEVLMRMINSGFQYTGGSSFDNCTHVPTELDLDLFTYPNDDGSEMGRIVIAAEDYIIRDPTTNRCIVQPTGTPNSLFNPFKIPGLNIRLTRGETEEAPALMQFCDSSL
jgi:hypothetical protein